jgi:c-di-GMP-binding flagellar brake protein YcgR
MEKEHWNGCQFHAAGQCPQQRAIERISLIPQLLPPSEIEAARKACEKCGQRRGEKRKHARTKRPLPVVLSKDDLPPVQGDIINISRGGAILKVRDSVGYTPGEKVRLEIYSPHLSVSKTPTQAVQLLGSIKRVEAREQTLAITFVEENDR